MPKLGCWHGPRPGLGVHNYGVGRVRQWHAASAFGVEDMRSGRALSADHCHVCYRVQPADTEVSWYGHVSI